MAMNDDDCCGGNRGDGNGEADDSLVMLSLMLTMKRVFVYNGNVFSLSGNAAVPGRVVAQIVFGHLSRYKQCT